jgi:hypothetical protein
LPELISGGNAPKSKTMSSLRLCGGFPSAPRTLNAERQQVSRKVSRLLAIRC